MSWTFTRYLLRAFASYLAGILTAVLAVFLVMDYVDRAKLYGGHPVHEVAELYGYKALVVVHQLGAGVLLLAAGATISQLRKRGELTAVGALTFGPRALYLPVAALSALLCVGLVAFDEYVVTRAARQVEEITVHRFNRWGDWKFFFTPKQWFRRGDQVFQLRKGDPDQGFSSVSIYDLAPDFTLASRVDAAKMTFVEGTRWKLEDAAIRRFSADGSSTLERRDGWIVDFGTGPAGFRVRLGRPEQMQLPELLEQVRTRREVGLPVQGFVLGLHNRFAYPLAGLPAALLAVGLALRSGRKGHLTTAMVEGLVIAASLWGLMVVCRTLVLSERLSPVLAAWLPFGVLAVAAGWLWAHHEGMRRRA